MEQRKHRTRWPLVIIGAVLVVLQAISIAGSSRSGDCAWQQPYFMAGQAFWYDLLVLVGFLGVGIAGAALVVLGLPKRRLLVAGCLCAVAILIVGTLALTGAREAAAEQEAAAAALASAEYIGSSQEDALHRPDCKYAGWISSKNMVAYTDLEEALLDGRHPCQECLSNDSERKPSFSEWTLFRKYGYGE